ncbi:hypothetical protein [Streptomyces sp. NPDC058726]|uniref:hypothetical protein n=1 Tax=Streptomyces sp. NPDC058726 TaxID=3346611 RepID=UPI00369E6994
MTIKISAGRSGDRFEHGVGMSWWDRKPEERAQWVLDPLVGVGPLRFGMDSDEVKAALGGVDNGGGQVSADGEFWVPYGDLGVTGIYKQGMLLVAVAINALDGPLVRLGDVELIGRVPSEVRSDIHELACREGVSVRLNWSGDPEIAAWGVSMGTAQEWQMSPERELQRQDAVITSALLVGPELAEDPYAAVPVIHWQDVREQEKSNGTWPVTDDHDRPLWEWTPLKSVGPLRFGMSPLEVSAALDGEAPAGRQGQFAHWWLGKSWPWTLAEERFERAGVSAHYWYQEGVPVLGAVDLHGRTGPQVVYADIRLVGMTPSSVNAALFQHIETHELGLLFGLDGDIGLYDFNMYSRVTRAGDSLVSAARFCAADWEEQG